MYSIVPFAMKFITDDVDLPQLLVRDLGSFVVFVCVKLTFDSQTHSGSRRSNKVYDYLMADKWFSSPILTDKGKEPMFDLVPFAGSRWQMTNRYILQIGTNCAFWRHILSRYMI